MFKVLLDSLVQLTPIQKLFTSFGHSVWHNHDGVKDEKTEDTRKKRSHEFALTVLFFSWPHKLSVQPLQNPGLQWRVSSLLS